MKKGKTKPRDLTDFFLEWRDTCAIDKCTRKDDVRYVHAMFDGKFREMVRGVRDSGLAPGAGAISEFSDSGVHAFHLVESEFYRPGEKSPEEGGKKFGRALKDHLFGNAGTAAAPGRLNGYFRQMLRTVVKDSFEGSLVSEPVRKDDGSASDPVDISPGVPVYGRQLPEDPAAPIAENECLSEFREAATRLWNESGTDFRLALLCDVCRVPRSTPAVVEASGLKKSAFALRDPVPKLRGIFERLSESHGFDVARNVVAARLADLVEELGREDPACRPFFEARDCIRAGKETSGPAGK